MKENNSRRIFIKNTAFSVAGLQAIALIISYGFGAKVNKLIFL